MSRGLLEDFVIFLSDKLIARANNYNGLLLAASYNDLNEAKKDAAIRAVLINIAEALSVELNEFYKRGN
jgi:hypothetical protein